MKPTLTSSTSTSMPTCTAPALTSLSVSKLNNQDLELELRKLVHQERKLLHLILLHIKEVDSRKLYLKKAYPSLFEYLVKEHGYSPAGAMRRIDAARLLRDVPQMAQKIQAGEINLSQITEISRALKEKQKEIIKESCLSSETKLVKKQQSKQIFTFISKQEKENLVLKVAGLSLAETQKLVALELNIKPKEFEKKRTQKDESVRLELTLTKKQIAKLNQCKDLAAHILEQKKMDTSLASVIEVLMDQFLKKQDARFSSKHKGITSNLEADKDLTSTMELSESTAVAFKSPKTLTAKAKSSIYQRDQCCQYRDPISNQKCGSTYKLEIDHKQPRWANGKHKENNLQVLCKNHNNFKYKIEAGLVFK